MKIKESQERIAIALEGILQELKRLNEPAKTTKKQKRASSYTEDELKQLAEIAEKAKKKGINYSKYVEDNWDEYRKLFPNRSRSAVMTKLYNDYR